MTARPSGAFCSPPSPSPSAMGIMPMIMAKAVMSTGRNRVTPASMAALAGSPWRSNSSLAKETTRILFAVPTPMHIMAPINAGTANSILVVSFAKELLLRHGDPARAAIEAGVTRFRPVLMTALAMIIGMIPMALGLGEGGEQNAPLGRAVIGGLLFATGATLIFFPAVFSLLHRRRDPSVAQQHPEGAPEPISA